MATTTKLDLSPIVLRNADTLVDLATKLEQDGTWQGSEPIMVSVAHSVRRLFDLLALDDHRLNVSEGKLYACLASHPALGEAFSEESDLPLGEDTLGRLPDFLRAAIEHDRREGTNLSGMSLAAIEGLAHAIAASRGAVRARERRVIQALIGNLRTMVAVLIDQGS